MVRYPYIFNVRILQFWRYPLSVLPSSNSFTPSEPYLFRKIIIQDPIPIPIEPPSEALKKGIPMASSAPALPIFILRTPRCRSTPSSGSTRNPRQALSGHTHRATIHSLPHPTPFPRSYGSERRPSCRTCKTCF